MNSFLIFGLAFFLTPAQIHDDRYDRNRLFRVAQDVPRNLTYEPAFTINKNLSNVNHSKNTLNNDDFQSGRFIYLDKATIYDREFPIPSYTAKNYSDRKKYSCKVPWIVVTGNNEQTTESIDLWDISKLSLEIAIILSNLFWFIISVYRVIGLNRRFNQRGKRRLPQILPDYGLHIHCSFLGLVFGLLLTLTDLFLVQFSGIILRNGCLWWQICGLSRKLLEFCILIYWMKVTMILIISYTKTERKPRVSYILTVNLLPYILSGIIQICLLLINKITSPVDEKKYNLSYHTISKPPHDCIYELFWNPSSILLNGITKILPNIFIISLIIKYLFNNRTIFNSSQAVLILHNSPKIFQPFKMNLYGILLSGILFLVTSTCHSFVNLITYQFYNVYTDSTPWLPLIVIRVHLLIRLFSLAILPIFMCQNLKVIKTLRNLSPTLQELDGEKFIQDSCITDEDSGEFIRGIKD